MLPRRIDTGERLLVRYPEGSMSRGCLLVAVWLGLGCSAAEPGAEPGGSSGSPSSAGASGAGGAVSSAAGATSMSGSAGVPGGAGSSVGGGGQSSGGAPLGGSGGAAAGGGAGAAGSAGSPGDCQPAAAGQPVVVGDTVHDPKTCLDWMKTTQTGVNYAAAETFCDGSALGGFDDWRIPSASELASIVTLCGKYPPEGPIDTTLFDLQGDGYWTSTSAGEPNKVCAIGMLNAGGYYHYGTAGPQVVRCVRGAGPAPMVLDCTAAQGCMNW